MRKGSKVGKEGELILRWFIEFVVATGGWLLKCTGISEKSYEMYFRSIHLGGSGREWEKEKHLSISSVPLLRDLPYGMLTSQHTRFAHILVLCTFL